MMSWRLIRAVAGIGLLAVVAPASAQLIPSLPPLGGTVDRVTGALPRVDRTIADARALAQAPLERARDLARRHPDRIALDADGNAVRAGELIVIDGDDAVIQAAQARGFRLIERVALDDLDLGYLRFATPAGMSLKRATRQLQALAPGREVTADGLHFASGSLGAVAGASLAPATPRGASRGSPIGIIDGGVPADTPGLVRQQGFAPGGPAANDHAVAIASLLTGGAGVRASAPGAQLHVADVYGSDPAGGNAAAIGQAIAWMARARVPVVVVSLVGPPNPLLARIVAAARRLGTVVVAAVGNDGPASRPAYPASYPGTIAVTGVDGRGRALIEAGRATKLDYAAPGADMVAAGRDGRARVVRGTSFAAPFVAARLAAHLDRNLDAAIAALDREARDIGKKGPDRLFGRGLVCADCATRPR
jgi:hypothetical protein